MDRTERRNAWLDRLEADGGPRSIREVVDVLIRASVGITGRGENDDCNRFAVMPSMTHRTLFMQGLDGRWNSGYQRCLGHLRRLMPELSPAMKNQRFVFLGGVLAAREAALADTTRHHPTWSAERTFAHFASTMTALLEAPGP